MPEMPHAGEDHGNIMFVGGSNDFIIAHGTTWLNDGADTNGTGLVQAISTSTRTVLGNFIVCPV